MLICECYESGWYYNESSNPFDFTLFDKKRRKRCVSCKNLINKNSLCLKFWVQRRPYSYIEEDIYGDEVPLANRFLCETCGEIYLNLSDTPHFPSLSFGLNPVNSQ